MNNPLNTPVFLSQGPNALVKDLEPAGSRARAKGLMQ
jgi:hypothetical protein